MGKRIILFICILLFIQKFSDAQIFQGFPKPKEGHVQSLEDGDETFSIYYGPRLLKGLYYEQHVDPNFKYYQLKDAGTIGLSSERIVSDLFGFGLDVMYSKANISYSQFVTGYYNGIYQQHTYDYNIKSSTLSVFLRANIHFFWLFNENIDVYTMVALGYRRTKFKTDSTDPNFEFNPNSYYSFGDPTFPVSGKFGFGFRYYFAEMIGVNLELGFGQPNISLGVNIRISK